MDYLMTGLSRITGLIGGPLMNEHELWQFHAHWGNTDDHGSEHTVDGIPYPAEVCRSQIRLSNGLRYGVL